MKIKKTLKYIAVTLLVSTLVLAYLADRDIVKIYGGLTEMVNVKQFKAKQGPLLIRNVNILSVDGERFIAGQNVRIKNGSIISIEASGSEPDLRGSIDGEGKFLIPGLTDSHVHLFKSRNDLLLYVANGVTQIRELIGEPDHLLWRQEIQNGALGPDLFIASPRIGTFGLIQGLFMVWAQGYINLTTAEEAKRAVKKMHQQGYDAVKIYSQISKEVYEAVTTTAHSLGIKVVGHVPWSLDISDIYSKQDGIGHLEEVMNALNREFGGFDNKSGEQWDFSGFSYDTSDEFLSFVEARSEDVASDLLEHDIAVTTTLYLVESFVRQKIELDQVLSEIELEYENPGISEWSSRAPGGIGWLPEVNRYKWPEGWDESRRKQSERYWRTYAKACQIILQSLIKAGVKVMAGTDANLPPTVPGFSLHDEFISLNESGMTASQVLMSATAQPAEWLNNNAGEISVGRKANLVMLDKNPLLDISNTKTINSVVLNGQLLDRALLDDILDAVKNANDSSRKVDINTYLD